MKDSKGLLLLLGALLLGAGALLGGHLKSAPPSGESFGGTVFNRVLEFSEGFTVDSTTVVDGSGNIDAPITSTTGTFSSTLVVTGATTLTGEVRTETLIVGGATDLAQTGVQVLTAAEMCNNSLIAMDPAGSSTTLTTDTAANLIADCLTDTGDTKTFFFENLADAAENYTITAGSSIDLIEPSGGDVVIAQNEDAVLTMLNVDGTNVKIFVTSLQAAD